jgi:hypothetical protein
MLIIYSDILSSLLKGSNKVVYCNCAVVFFTEKGKKKKMVGHH